MRARLLDPGWREDDFARIKDDAINAIKVGLRNNDEELAKEVLYAEHLSRARHTATTICGTVTLAREAHARRCEAVLPHAVQPVELILGNRRRLLAGVPGRHEEGLHSAARRAAASAREPKPPALIEANRVVIVDKDTRSVAISIGFPILDHAQCTPDYPALLLAASYLGQHRMSGGVLYDELREKRGLNYGDYAYIEYFPQGMFLMEPPQNLARHQQIFQIWIRPVEPPTAKFALRLALYQAREAAQRRYAEEDFERTRDFLSKYVNVLTRTKRAELGYAIDSIWYGMRQL